MLVTVSTIKDSLDNVEFFVSANLSSGADHMVVFLDAPRDPSQAEVEAFLTDHPHVTCIPTDRKEWWREDRPASLNVRQRINANWTRAVLAPFDWAEWLFHVDGDEVARLHRAALAGVPDSVDAVWLRPLEAVSQPAPVARPTQFKRLLDDEDLNLLHVLGAVDSPSNQTYFHGHVMGKSGIRPASGLALSLHHALDREGRPASRHEDERLQVLHYDAISGEEFIRKWSALARAGHARFRASRAPTARALKSLVSRDLPDETRERYLRRVYELTTQDDVGLLEDLRLLEHLDPRQDPTTARPLPEGAGDLLSARVQELSGEPKLGYYVPDAARVGEGGRSPMGRGRRALGRLTRRP